MNDQSNTEAEPRPYASERCCVPRTERDDWLLLRVHEERTVDMLNRGFVEDYIRWTGAAFRPSFWGAPWCGLLSSDLARLAREKVLKRTPLGLPSGNWQPGFPKWVYSYRVHYIGEARLRSRLSPGQLELSATNSRTGPFPEV